MQQMVNRPQWWTVSRWKRNKNWLDSTVSEQCNSRTFASFPQMSRYVLFLSLLGALLITFTMLGYRCPISQALLPLQLPHDIPPQRTNALRSLPFYKDRKQLHLPSELLLQTPENNTGRHRSPRVPPNSGPSLHLRRPAPPAWARRRSHGAHGPCKRQRPPAALQHCVTSPAPRRNAQDRPGKRRQTPPKNPSRPSDPRPIRPRQIERPPQNLRPPLRRLLPFHPFPNLAFGPSHLRPPSLRLLP